MPPATMSRSFCRASSIVWSTSESCWPRPKHKPVRANDAQERGEAELAGLEDDDPAAVLPVDLVDDRMRRCGRGR